MGTIIGLGDKLREQSLPAIAALNATTEFTRRDRMDLAAWAQSGRRVALTHSEIGTFAMLHRGGQPWASWGVMRQRRTVLIWNAVSLADIARAPTMIEALAAIADVAALPPVHNVVSFADALYTARPARSS